MTDDSSKPPKASKEDLLGELESIKDLLDENDSVDQKDGNIPVLDDVFNHSQQYTPPEDAAKLLNLDNIFEDDDDVLESQGNDSNSAIDFDNLDDFNELDIDIAIPDFTLSTVETDADNQPAISTDQQQSQQEKPSPIDMELLIQEIVDEFIPSLEAQLRKRLSECSPEVIKQLANKYVKP